jgi:hypothetical protein
MPASYIIARKEIGESGTPHLQGFVLYNQRMRFASAKAYIMKHAHFELARNVEAAIDFCKKDGEYFEAGT